MPTERARNIRLAAMINMTLGALILASILLAQDRLAALWSAGFIGLGLIIWGAIDAWAAWGSNLRGTKLLAMFMAILGMALVGTAWIIPHAPLYRVAATLLGILVVGVSLADAFISPDETRRERFEPRRPQDKARPPTGL